MVFVVMTRISCNNKKEFPVLGEAVPKTEQLEGRNSKPTSGSSRCGSANHIERTIPTIKRKDSARKEEDLSNHILALNISSNKSGENNSAKENVTTHHSKSSVNESGDMVSSPRSRAPLELSAEFLNAVMKKDYKTARSLCEKILAVEPDNATCKEFEHVLTEALKQEFQSLMDEASSEDESDGEEELDNSDEVSDDSDYEEDEESNSSNDDSEESEEGEKEESDEELTINEINKLNLLVGGVSVVKS